MFLYNNHDIMYVPNILEDFQETYLIIKMAGRRHSSPFTVYTCILILRQSKEDTIAMNALLPIGVETPWI